MKTLQSAQAKTHFSSIIKNIEDKNNDNKIYYNPITP